MDEKEVFEKCAALEHERWSRWHKYAVKNWTPENIARWNRQAETPYSELTELEKNAHRREVRDYFSIWQEFVVKKNEEIDRLKAENEQLSEAIDRLSRNIPWTEEEIEIAKAKVEILAKSLQLESRELLQRKLDAAVEAGAKWLCLASTEFESGIVTPDEAITAMLKEIDERLANEPK